MVFSSIPAYHDPANWQQQSNHQTGNTGAIANSQLTQSTHPAPSPPPLQPHVGGGPVGIGSIRPGSMAERARLANMPMPETPQKCPRCESSNTKFCYFNNYSLSQPRHFCKTCRRYWTRGGALRNVPVGGGCRRNKRSKASSSKSPVSSDRQTTSTSTSTISSNSTEQANILGLAPQIPPLRFLSPLSQLTDHYTGGDISLNYSDISAPVVGTGEMNFQIGTNLLGSTGVGGGLASLLSSGSSIEQWRLQQVQQFPFLGGLDSSPGLYQFQGSNVEPSGFDREAAGQVRPKLSTASMLTQFASVKMEDNQGLNLSRQLMAGIPGNDQWTGAAWTDLTSFSSSSTSNPL